MSSNLSLSFWAPEGNHWPCRTHSGGEHRGRKVGRGREGTMAEDRNPGLQQATSHLRASPPPKLLQRARDQPAARGLWRDLRTEQSQSGAPEEGEECDKLSRALWGQWGRRKELWGGLPLLLCRQLGDTGRTQSLCECPGVLPTQHCLVFLFPPAHLPLLALFTCLWLEK